MRYDLCREEGNGDVLSIDVHGPLDPTDLDLILADINAHPDEYGLPWDDERGDYAAPYRGWNVHAYYRATTHPLECDDPTGPDCWHDWDEYIYRSTDGPPLRDGEVLVTSLEIDWTWRYRCYNHRDRVAVAGLPAENFLPPGPDEAPDPIIDGYLYVCRDCQVSHDQRVETSRAIWTAEIKRRQAAGLPERLVYA